ncbi:MAG: hypothetical protein KDA70_19915, partial [Planctomycetaceae bacterium]|nr:hypothetical protein [Planctomycetaceae bacterium]
QWEKDVQPLLERINVYEIRSRAGMTARRRSRTGPQNEAQRFILLAQHYFEAGDLAQAEVILTALVDLLNENSDNSENSKQDEMRDLAQQMLNELQNDPSRTAERFIMLTQSMANADALVNEKKFDEAARVWKALIILYEQDQAEVARDMVRKARQKLESLPELKQAAQTESDSQKENTSNE